MKTLFTIHAGEFLVGDFIERNFRSLNVWLPAKDTGVDLLVTNPDNQRAISLQVKFSRDYKNKPVLRLLGADGWWKLNRKNIGRSRADYWVLVLLGFAHRSTDFVIIKPSALLRRLDAIHGEVETIQSYLWVTKDNRCWEARGLNKEEETQIVEGRYGQQDRDFTEYLNRWGPIESMLLRSAASA